MSPQEQSDLLDLGAGSVGEYYPFAGERRIEGGCAQPARIRAPRRLPDRTIPRLGGFSAPRLRPNGRMRLMTTVGDVRTILSGPRTFADERSKGRTPGPTATPLGYGECRTTE